MVWKNYAVAAVNILVSSLPLFAIWDPIVGICYCGATVLLLALLSWNMVGDFVVVLFILHAKEVPSNALIAPSLQRYLRYLLNHELKNQRAPSLYYADSKIPYYMPVSARSAVVSLALEDRLQRDGERLLIQGVPKDAYVPKIMISRKVALLSLASYAIVIRIMEFWAIFFAVAVKAIMASLVPHIHTGSKIWSIFLIIHSFGEWWVMENIQKSFDMREIGFNIGYCKKIINSDGENYPFDCLRPKQYKSDSVDEYICSLKKEKENNTGKKLFTFRSSARPASDRFDSEENRTILEQELMEAGLKIYNLPQNRTQYMRPMGFDNRITFGLGSYFATFMNMSNNCPLAYWWGDADAGDWHPLSKWYPLLPRRAHENVEPCAW